MLGPPSHHIYGTNKQATGELEMIGISFRRWNLYVDDNYVRNRIRWKGFWTPFYTAVIRTKSVYIHLDGGQNASYRETQDPVS